jgi:Mg2+ and Co2+ transporter CorA
MQSGGHLLLVLHGPPGDDPDVRDGLIFWRDPTGKWTPSGTSPSQPGVGDLLTKFEKSLDQLQAAEDTAKSARDYFNLLNRLNPMVRTARNLYQALQDAREAEPGDRQLLLWRDRAYAINRAAELLHNDAKNALDFAVAQRAEEEAVSSRRVAAAAHRLNILAAFFFPLATLAAIFGMEMRNGLEMWDQQHAPLPMLGILGVGLVLGCILTMFITRKP